MNEIKVFKKNEIKKGIEYFKDQLLTRTYKEISFSGKRLQKNKTKDTYLSDEGCKVLNEILSQNKTIERLNLNCNPIK
jgi:hypothetical protein